VTGESREGAVAMLRDRILPNLVGRGFDSQDEVRAFLNECDGKAPAGWVGPDEPQTAAWGAVDLALLDVFGREFGQPALALDPAVFPDGVRYSGVLSSDTGWKLIKTALKMRLFGLRSIKMKIEGETTEETLRSARRALGRRADIRVDANMAWSVDDAIETMKTMSSHGIRSFEQPVDPADLEGLSRLVRETGLEVMADESLDDADSLRRLIDRKACTAVNVRISKCGGLIGALNRCRDALRAGLRVQVGCQVGESSLLSSAHLMLVAAVRDVTYVEGLFGERLLREDPVSPVLHFGYGGRAPARPGGPGLGVTVDESILRRHATGHETIGPR
jgi:muconate cycloisomerase